MAPVLRQKLSLPRDKFSGYFGALTSQPYSDLNSSRGGSSFNLRSIAWNPVSNLIATGASDKTLRVWNPEKPHVRFSTELKGHQAPIEKVAFNPVKDAELCSLSNDGVLKLWDVRTKACINEVRGLGDAFTLAWAPDGQSMIVGNKSDNVFIVSPTQSTPLASYQQSMQTNQIVFCWSGKKVFATTSEGKTRVLTYPDLEPVLLKPYAVPENESREYMLHGHASSCLSAELSPTGRWLATGGSDSLIAMWDTTDWLCQRTLTKMSGPVRSISFTFDGSYIVGGSEEGSGLEVCYTETGESVHTFKTAGPCPVVAWAPTRYCLAYGDLGILRIVGVDTDGGKR